MDWDSFFLGGACMALGTWMLAVVGDLARKYIGRRP
jgi:hypothetical protein